MPDEPTTAAAQAAAPVTAPAQAATTTSPDALAADGNSESISLEAARKLRSEAEVLRKRLKAYEAAEEAAKLAALDDVDKERKLREKAEKQIQQYKQELINAQVRLAAKDKGIIDPDMAALALHDKLEYDDSGMPSNLDKALDDLIKNKPYLVPKPDEPAPASAAQTANRTPVLPGMNPSRSGRSDIPSPAGTTLPGQRVRLTDPGMWKT